MFRQLAQLIDLPPSPPPPPVGTAPPYGVLQVLQAHPLVLQRALEILWSRGGFEFYDPASTTATLERLFLGDSGIVDALAMPQKLLNELTLSDEIDSGVKKVGPFPWEHLIYAYLIENTRVLPIFRRVVELYASGEQLEVPSPATRQWLRATEDLFFRDPPQFVISSLTSWARPDLEATRRNAYWRMFGMDLNHGAASGGPYPYAKAVAGNDAFVNQWEALLAEVWQGYINRQNTSGENYADPESVANLADGLAKIMRVRRLQGNLAREEFFFTAMLAWFHLTLDYDTPVVVDLKATAASPEERLRKIGERVRITSHPKSRSFFDMAQPASSILRFVELEKFSNAAGAGTLTDGVGNTRTREDALIVINHWSIATGRDLKLRRPPNVPASQRPRTSTPQVVTSPGPVAQPALNGTR